MPITDEIRALILERSSSRVIRKLAISQGLKSLREDGWRLIGEGKTTVEEVAPPDQGRDLRRRRGGIGGGGKLNRLG